MLTENIYVLPYLIGDCAFSLDKFWMKTSSKAQRRKNPMLMHLECVAFQTRWPIECAFRMLKGKFEALKFGVRLTHEEEIVRLCYACVIIHNLCLDLGNVEHDIEFKMESLSEQEDEIVTTETNEGIRQRDALMYYLISV